MMNNKEMDKKAKALMKKWGVYTGTQLESFLANTFKTKIIDAFNTFFSPVIEKGSAWDYVGGYNNIYKSYTPEEQYPDNGELSGTHHYFAREWNGEKDVYLFSYATDVIYVPEQEETSVLFNFYFPRLEKWLNVQQMFNLSDSVTFTKKGFLSGYEPEFEYRYMVRQFVEQSKDTFLWFSEFALGNISEVFSDDAIDTYVFDNNMICSPDELRSIQNEIDQANRSIEEKRKIEDYEINTVVDPTKSRMIRIHGSKVPGIIASSTSTDELAASLEMSGGVMR